MISKGKFLQNANFYLPFLQEYFSLNDGVDNINGDDDFTPFRNIMNEYYARDTSKKIKSPSF